MVVDNCAHVFVGETKNFKLSRNTKLHNQTQSAPHFKNGLKNISRELISQEHNLPICVSDKKENRENGSELHSRVSFRRWALGGGVPLFPLGLNMARTSVDDEAWAGFDAIAFRNNLDPEAVAGKVVGFWKRTQDLGIAEADKRQLGFFLKISEETMLTDFIDGMVSVGFLQRLNRAKFCIVGNAKHIQKLHELRAKAKVGGQSRAAKSQRGEDGKFQPSENKGVQSNQMLQAPASTESSAILCNAMQFNALNPPTPPLKGGRRKNKKTDATRMVTHIVGAVRKFGTDETQARPYVGEQGWSILHREYDSWENFCRSYERHYHQKQGTIFKAQLRSMVSAFLEEATA